VSVAEAEALMYLSLTAQYSEVLSIPTPKFPIPPILTLTLTLPKGKLMCLSLDRAQ
jgi:hypothetical protein